MCTYEQKCLGDLRLDHYNYLVASLNQNAAWERVAFYAIKHYNAKRLETLIGTMGSSNSAEKLLIELQEMNWAVERLASVLKKCNLLEALSVFRDTEPLAIIQQPTDDIKVNLYEIAMGDRLKMTCKASGSPPPKYLWFHENNELQDQTTEQLNITINNVSQEGEYKCRVRQHDFEGRPISEIFSEIVLVGIEAMPITILRQPPPSVDMRKGEKLVLSCEVKCHPSPKFQWYHDDEILDGQTSDTLVISNFTSDDEGEYKCNISNKVSERDTVETDVMIKTPREVAVKKVALLIGNNDYEHSDKLEAPVNEVFALKISLEEIGFKVKCYQNLSLTKMKEVIMDFGKSLTKDDYGFYFYGGHGIKYGLHYMLPVDAPKDIEMKSCNLITENHLLNIASKNKPALLVVILDMCRKLPELVDDKECPLMKEPPNEESYESNGNLIRAYATSNYQSSYESSACELGYYVKNLIKHIKKDITVTRLLHRVQKACYKDLESEKCEQVPEVKCSLTKAYRLTDKIQGQCNS